MDIQSINADRKLANVAAAIGRNPRSWMEWHCLMIDISALNEEQKQDCVIWTRSVITSYLSDIEGRVYFCEEGTIHILARQARKEILHEMGQQICALILSETSESAEYNLLDLYDDGIFYAQHVFERIGQHNSLSVSAYGGLDELIDATMGRRPLLPYVQDVETGQLKILLVEDDPVTRWMVRNSLKNHCHFACAPTASKAYEMYKTYHPDIVFLDIGLPDQSGRIVLDWIIRHNPSACVVMFSSNNHLDAISGALEAGATGFIAKPFLKEHLMHYLNNFRRV